MALKKKVKKEIFCYLKITFGLVLCALGLDLFLIPNKIAAGGVSGIATILFHLWKLPVGATMLVCNIILFVIAFKIIGKTFSARSIYSVIVLSALIDLFHYLLPVKAFTNDLLIAVIFGNLLNGIGLAIVFNNGSSTGGTDIIAKIINRYTKLEIGKSLLIADFAIGAMAGVVLRSVTVGMYSLLAIIINTFTIDAFLVSINIKKQAFIVSSCAELIAERILKELNRGVTYIDAKGAYTGEKRKAIICVVGSRQIHTLIEIVREVDEHAFLAVSNVNEVRGEGFKDIKSLD